MTLTPLADITVAIATVDRPQSLARCLDAVLSGKVRPAEIVIVDQSPTDATAMVVAQRGRAAVPIHYLRQNRRGLSASRNAAIAQATASIVAFTDDDCVPDRDWITILDRAFASAENPDAVTGRVLPLGPPAHGAFAVSSRTSTEAMTFTGKTHPWWVGTGGNLAVKRMWFERVGPYDERLGAGSAGGAGEDMDILYRLLRAGARIRYDPDAVIFHERTTRARWLATRSSYGRGIGVFCGLWLRRGDLYALRMLARWTLQHGRALADGLLRLRLMAIYEELLMLGGTVRGLLLGFLPRARGSSSGPRDRCAR